MAEPLTELVDGVWGAAGQNLHPTIGEIPGMAGDAKFLGDACGAGPEKYALDAALHETATADRIGHYWGCSERDRMDQRPSLMVSAIERA